MKKNLIVASVALFLIVSPAYASQNQKNNENRTDENHGQVVSSEHRGNENEKKETPIIRETVSVTIDISPSPSSVPTPKIEDKDDKDNKEVKGARTTEECDSEGSWKNHGEYVSCVAKQHLGGKEVSDAAKSDIGKKSDEDGDDGDDDITPTITPSVSPSVSPTITPPLTSPATELHFSLTSWEDLKKLFAQLFRGFRFNRNHNG